jgi:hypothetical protein
VLEDLWIAKPPGLWLPQTAGATDDGRDEEDDGEQYKEVYARYGLAMYQAQVLEHGIVNVLVITRISEARAAAARIVNDPWEQRFRDTMSEMARRLKANPVATPELIDHIGDAIKLRNFLAHGFFRERAEEWFSRSGRLGMIAELEQAAKTFSDANHELEVCSRSMMDEFGATPEALQAKFDEMLAQAKARDQVVDL